MASITFTENLRVHLECPPAEVDAATVHDALQRYFETNPKVRSYLLDEQGALRKHVVVFVDGVMVRDRARLSDAIAPNANIYVMQALSGG